MDTTDLTDFKIHCLLPWKLKQNKKEKASALVTWGEYKTLYSSVCFKSFPCSTGLSVLYCTWNSWSVVKGDGERCCSRCWTLNMEAEQEGDLSLRLSLRLSLSMWRSGMNQTASCDGWSWKLSARELFKAVQVHRQLLPSKIDARAALKDCSLVQSLGTEIEAHPWQSNGDTTHHRRIIWREGRWKTQGPYSINPVYWKSRLSTKLEDQSTVKQEARSSFAFYSPFVRQYILFFLLKVAWCAE